MTEKRKSIFSSTVLKFTLLLAWSAAFSQSQSLRPSEPVAETAEQYGDFIAAFDWAVETRPNFLWPFEAVPPAPYQSVWVVVESMPRAWSEKRGEKSATPLSAYECLRVNGHSLPKPRRAATSQQAFRISLEDGRLRFSFSLPAGLRLHSRYKLVRIRLYQTGNDRNRVAFRSFEMRDL